MKSLDLIILRQKLENTGIDIYVGVVLFLIFLRDDRMRGICIQDGGGNK